MAEGVLSALIALVGVFSSVTASLFVSLRQSSIETQKLRDEYVHRYAGKLFEKRLEVYPELLSPFVDVIHKINLKQATPKDIKDPFPILTEWDTKNAIFLGAQPQQTIHRLYLMLADLSQMSDSEIQDMLNDSDSLRQIKNRFLDLFLAFKNDLGIYSLKSPSAITNSKDPSSFSEVDELSGIREKRYMVNRVPPNLK